jgi:hypothetical protein
MTSRYPFAPFLPLLAVLVYAACSTSTTPGGNTGSVDVTVATTGEDIDSDGYTVTLGTDERPIAVDGSVTFTGLEAGIYAVTLGDVAENCDVAGSNPVSAPVVLGPPVEIGFAVECEV